MSLEGTAVIVTGATAGIGRATALAFAKAGARLMLTGRDEARGTAVAAACRAAGAPAVSFIAADVTTAGVPDRIVAAACDTFGRLDVLVNNAGILFHGTALACTDAEWDETFAVNVTSVFRFSRAAVRVMKPQGSGCIVNVASDWALVAAREAAAYGASKGAVVQLTRSMAADHARDGIRINAVCPGDTDTPMLAKTMPPGDRAQALAVMGDRIPLGRVAQPDEVARAILFLAGDGASFITGALLPVDGGNSAV
jgi:NAD(P)-dependent dehydrogenase (short-subunit alcohol dehydrogenase family)